MAEKIIDILGFIDAQYPTWQTFLLVKHDHVPSRNETNVSISKVIQFRIYNPDSSFGIDLDTFKVRIDGGVWYRYGDSRLIFNLVNYREYLVYFNSPNFIYNSQVEVEVYCEDDHNNPGIKLEIL